jgi:cyclopropane fatty-acyl-phospholipid synthase-like methyltransferase
METTHERQKQLKSMQRFKNLDYESFRRAALDPSLTPNERIGFPDEYRAGREEAILSDIRNKLPLLNNSGKTVVDIGPGCAKLAHLIIELCGQQGHSLVLIDSLEMLDHLPQLPFVRKVPGCFPCDSKELLSELHECADVLLTYSVFHYVFNEQPWHRFLDGALDLLAPGGEMLIGDIPNVSKRKRFFSSEAGVRFHQAFMQTDTRPEVCFNCMETGQIDDGTVLDIVLRCRIAGYDAYVVPQNEGLPMANRREDILIRRP